GEGRQDGSRGRTMADSASDHDGEFAAIAPWRRGWTVVGLGGEECAAADDRKSVDAAGVRGEIQLADLSVCRGGVDRDRICVWPRTGVAGYAGRDQRKLEKRRPNRNPETAG